MTAPAAPATPDTRPLDFAAIGLGPFNLGLACLTAPIRELRGVFLESRPGFDWHAGMLLEGSTLQTPFLADLVTLADPASSYSFLSFLKQTGRLYSFYIRESFFPLRSEYVAYCRWAAARLGGVRFGRHVTAVTWDGAERCYLIETACGETYRARALVLGTGTPPYVPEAVRGFVDGRDDAVHSSRYLEVRDALRRRRAVTVVGSGQSAAEIYLDLLRTIDTDGYRLDWVTSSPRFFPLEYTKLTLEMTSPEYTDYFHALPAETRDRLAAAQKGLYKGINSELVNEIYDLLYVKSRQGRPTTRLLTTRLLTNVELTGAAYDGQDGAYTLTLRQTEQGKESTLRTEALVLATGYRYRVPAFLAPIADRVAWDERGRYAVRRDYTVHADHAADGPVYVQNAELHTHGFVAPDLGMAAYRNSWIIRGLTGREHYPIERSIAFQEFAA